MRALTPSQSRLLAVALLLLVLVLLVQLVLVPLWLRWSEGSERIRLLEKRLDVYERLAEGLPADQQRLTELQATQPTSNWYLAQATPALAAASLQQLLHRQVSRSGGQVISTQIINRLQNAPIPAVSVQVHFRSELEELVDLLYSLETSRPVLILDNVTILANPRRAVRVVRSRERDVRQPDVPSLDVRFDMTGYAHQEEGT